MTSEFRWYGERAKKQIHTKIVRGLTGMAADTVKLAIANASQPKGGASHPQRQTSTLVRALTMDVDERNLTAKVGIIRGSADADEALVYAEPLELGSADGTRPPYPYLFPAAETITKRAREYFR